MKPKRIQRKRTKGWRMPPNTISVSRPSRWGNRHTVGAECSTCGKPHTAQQAVDEFRKDVRWHRASSPAWFEEWIAPLRDKSLACWCGLDWPCHVDPLLELAAENMELANA